MSKRIKWKMSLFSFFGAELKKVFSIFWICIKELAQLVLKGFVCDIVIGQTSCIFGPVTQLLYKEGIYTHSGANDTWVKKIQLFDQTRVIYLEFSATAVAFIRRLFWLVLTSVTLLTFGWRQNWVIHPRQSVAAPVFVEWWLVGSDVDSLLHTSIKVASFFVQYSDFVFSLLICPGPDVIQSTELWWYYFPTASHREYLTPMLYQNGNAFRKL